MNYTIPDLTKIDYTNLNNQYFTNQKILLEDVLQNVCEQYNNKILHFFYILIFWYVIFPFLYNILYKYIIKDKDKKEILISAYNFIYTPILDGIIFYGFIMMLYMLIQKGIIL